MKGRLTEGATALPHPPPRPQSDRRHRTGAAGMATTAGGGGERWDSPSAAAR